MNLIEFGKLFTENYIKELNKRGLITTTKLQEKNKIILRSGFSLNVINKLTKENFNDTTKHFMNGMITCFEKHKIKTFLIPPVYKWTEDEDYNMVLEVRILGNE